MKPLEYIRERIRTGHYTFSREEAGKALCKDGAVLSSTLNRLKHDGWVYPLSRGFYLVLDLQHQAKGILDPVWFVDEWAHHHKVEYYVAGLSAAELHGAAHQRPMQFQVFADRQLRSVKHPRIHLAVLYKKSISKTMREKRKSPAGYFYVSTPEITACDIIAYHRCCPSLDHAATVLVELGEALSAEGLAELAEQGYMPTVLQRLGWLMDYVGWQEKTGPLHDVIERRRLRWHALDTRLSAKGERDDRWKLIVNTDVQPDIER